MKKNNKMSYEQKWSLGLTIFTVVMLSTIGILIYSVDGTTKWPFWVFMVPMAGVRLWRAILLIKDATGKSEYMQELRKRAEN